MAFTCRDFGEIFDGKHDLEIYGTDYTTDGASLPTETAGCQDADGNNFPPAATGSRYISAAGEAYVLFNTSGWTSL